LLNLRRWASENPHWFIQARTIREASVMVWAGIIGGNVVGPFFFENNVNGEVYLNLLGDEVLPRLEELEIDPREIVFQQDGAPAHNHRDVVQWLNENIPQWIGTNANVRWPPRSPDLTPLDFTIWPFIKNRVYRTQPDSMEDLRKRIIDAFEDITPEMLRNVQGNVLRRLNTCLAAEGHHFEQFL
jgi:hypothetical protein